VAAFYVLKGTQSDAVRWSAFAGSLVLGALVFAVSAYGRDLWKFFLEARIELYKVFWPTREETGSMTLVVFVFVLIMALFFWGVDSFLGWATRSILGRGAGGEGV
jgi:preprotein translocase subunit SecE